MRRLQLLLVLALAVALPAFTAACGSAAPAIPAPVRATTTTAPSVASPPTWTPLPPPSTPTPSSPPQPGWQVVQSWFPPMGRYFSEGTLAPDGQTVVLFSQPVGAQEAQALDLMVHVYRVGVEKPMWEGRLQDDPPLKAVVATFWLPDGRLALNGYLANSDPALRVVRADTMEVVWSKDLVALQDYPPHQAAYDAQRQRLLVNEQGLRRLEAYTWPGREWVEKYTASDMSNGCCVPQVLYSSQHGVAAVGLPLFDPRRYTLMWWDGSGPQAQLLPTRYDWDNWQAQAVVWGPSNQIAWIVMPTDAERGEPTILEVVDITTGKVVWSTNDAEAFPGMNRVAWLPQRGWLVGSSLGEIRLYTGAKDYEVVRWPRENLYLYGLSTNEAQNARWLALFNSRVEVWDWK